MRAHNDKVGLFLAGSMLCGQAGSMTELIIFRGIQGLGAGGLMTLAQTVIADVVEPRERGRYQALFTGAFAASSVAGPILGGVITDLLSWRWVFYVNLPVGALALLLLHLGLSRTPPLKARAIDYPGAGMLAGLTTIILLVLSWGGTVMPWGSTLILGLAGQADAAAQLARRDMGEADVRRALAWYEHLRALAPAQRVAALRGFGGDRHDAAGAVLANP